MKPTSMAVKRGGLEQEARSLLSWWHGCSSLRSVRNKPRSIGGIAHGLNLFCCSLLLTGVQGGPLQAQQQNVESRHAVNRPSPGLHPQGVVHHRPPEMHEVVHRDPVEKAEQHVQDALTAASPTGSGQEAAAPTVGLSFPQEREQLASAFRASACPHHSAPGPYTTACVLTAALRPSVAAAGLSAASGLGNHLTMSVGPDYTRFLLNRYGLHWMEVTAENLVLVDADGTILEGEGPVQGAAVALHGPIHAARRERARVIFHTHQPWFTALACIKAGGLRMFHPDACIYSQRVGFDPVYTG